jgi:hypothetical protein
MALKTVKKRNCQRKRKKADFILIKIRESQCTENAATRRVAHQMHSKTQSYEAVIRNIRFYNVWSMNEMHVKSSLG